MSISVMYKPAILIGTGSNVPTSNDPEAYKYLTDGFSSFTVPSDIGIVNGLKSYAFAGMFNLRRLDFNNTDVIPSYCCQSNSNLREIIANQVLEIGPYAFSANVNLESVSFSKLFSVSDGAFAINHRLSNVNFLSNVLFLGRSAFVNCSSLENVELNDYTVLNDNTFQYCTSLKGCEIKGFGTDMNSHSYVFAYCSNLETVKFNRITALGSHYFIGCSKLSSIINSDLIGYPLGIYAFSGCETLSSLFAPLVFYTGQSAFWNCKNLKEATICTSQMISGLFSNCNSLESLYLLICSVVSMNAAQYIFSNTPMLDSSYLGHYGSIYVPSSWVASYKADSRWRIISDRITSLPSEYDSRFVYAYEFLNRSDITEIPASKSGAEYVCAYAFSNCYNLANVELPNAKLIGLNAFANCRSLVSLSVPSCQHFDQGAFTACTKLSDIYAPSLLEAGWICFYNTTAIKSFVAPNCKTIAFTNNVNNMSNFDFPEALYFVVNISGALWSSTITNLNVPKAKYVYFYSHNLSSVFLPEAVIVGGLRGPKLERADLPKARILRGTFSSCHKLLSVSAPEVIEIGSYAFLQCSLLTNIDADKAYEIGDAAFSDCIGLSKISLKRAEMIRNWAFSGCYNIKKILTCNLSYIIGWSVFLNCHSLESLYMFKKQLCSLAYSNILDNTPITNSSYLGHYGSIYVPSQLLSWYRTHSQWSRFSDRFVGLTDQEIDDVINNW